MGREPLLPGRQDRRVTAGGSNNASAGVRDEHFDGKIRSVLFGFTDASKAECDANNDVPFDDDIPF